MRRPGELAEPPPRLLLCGTSACCSLGGSVQAPAPMGSGVGTPVWPGFALEVGEAWALGGDGQVQVDMEGSSAYASMASPSGYIGALPFGGPQGVLGWEGTLTMGGAMRGGTGRPIALVQGAMSAKCSRLSGAHLSGWLWRYSCPWGWGTGWPCPTWPPGRGGTHFSHITRVGLTPCRGGC